MPSNKQAPDSTQLALHHIAALATLPGVTAGNGEETQEEAGIVQKTRTDVVRQRAAHARFSFGQQVLNAAASATDKRFVDFVEEEQAILSRTENQAVRQRVAHFFNRVAEDHANALLDTRQILEERVKEVLASAVDPPAGREEEYAVEVPNLLTRIFGGHTTVKRVRR
jgi:hypothetical protein